MNSTQSASTEISRSTLLGLPMFGLAEVQISSPGSDSFDAQIGALERNFVDQGSWVAFQRADVFQRRSAHFHVLDGCLVRSTGPPKSSTVLHQAITPPIPLQENGANAGGPTCNSASSTSRSGFLCWNLPSSWAVVRRVLAPPFWDTCHSCGTPTFGITKGGTLATEVEA